MNTNFEKVPEGKGIVSFSIDEMLHQLERYKEGETDCLAKTGFEKLDDAISGYVKGELTVIGSRPGMGKTSFMLNQLVSVGHIQKVPVAYFSIELSMQLIMERITAILTGKRYFLGSIKKYEENDRKRITDVLEELKGSPIHFFDAPYCMIHDLCEEMRILADEKQVKVFFIDYLQAIRTVSKKGTIRDEELAYVLRKLKGFARENNVSVVLNSTLSRSVETRGGDKRPMLADLRESGHIEQMADKVMFIYRPEYYNITEDEKGQSLLGTSEIIVAKNSRGPLENFRLRFDMMTGNFRNEIDLDKIDFNDLRDVF